MVEVVAAEGRVVVHLRGDADMSTVAEVRDSIEPFLAPSQTIVLDLANVRFADSSLLNVLAQARGELSKAGGSLLLRNPSRSARRLLTLAELDDLVRDETDRQNRLDERPRFFAGARSPRLNRSAAGNAGGQLDDRSPDVDSWGAGAGVILPPS